MLDFHQWLKESNIELEIDVPAGKDTIDEKQMRTVSNFPHGNYPPAAGGPHGKGKSRYPDQYYTPISATGQTGYPADKK